MHESMTWVIVVIIIAFAFDFMNGFHDAANSVATIVSTRVLRPHMAVIWAAFFNFIAFLFFGLHVANTIGKGVVDPHIIDATDVTGALVGAISWGLITWYYGIPSSSSHALIGGLAGSAIVKGGMSVLNAKGIITIVVSIILSPLLGFILAYILMMTISIVFFRSQAKKTDRYFHYLQF